MSDPAGELLDHNPRQTCNVNGETLTFREFGKGNPHVLVFLPGLFANADSWGALLAVRLSEDHHVIAVNPRGYGGSTENVPAATHLENAKDIKALIDQLGIAKAMVMGYSTGGGTAACLAIHYPDIFVAAFLNSSIPLDGYRMQKMNMNGELEDCLLLTKQDVKEQVEVFSALGMQRKSIKQFHAVQSQFCSAIPNVDSPLLQRWHQGNMEHQSLVAAIRADICFNVMPIQTPVSPPSMVLQNLRSKLIVIHGAADPLIPVAQVRTVTQLAIAEGWAPTNMLSYYEHAKGHFPLFKAADEFIAVYRKTLQEQVLTDTN